MTQTPLRLYDSLTRGLVDFTPVEEGKAKVYSCGPTVYNYPHIGNMRAYVFADTLGRTLAWKGYDLIHIINITDVGHLTSDADAGDDKMEKAAAEQAVSIWDIARHYTQAYWADVERLNIRQPAKWSIATDHIEGMIEFAKKIAPTHCYELDTGLYFDVSTVPDYGRLARAITDEGEARIDAVAGKRNAADFAIWRKTPSGEIRQMEWDSPWGRGAPGWHLECSVMAMQYLGAQFDIHTGGIDHREIHHPNEIAQNQAFTCSSATGANIWMHNNFLVERQGKMSKSSGEFLTLQSLIDRGFHPLAYRMMCLQAHYRSELEFSFDNLNAAFTRLKRLVMAFDEYRAQWRSHATYLNAQKVGSDRLLETLAPQDHEITNTEVKVKLAEFEEAISDDLNTAKAIVVLEQTLSLRRVDVAQRLAAVTDMLEVLGFDFHLTKIDRPSLRTRPVNAALTEIAVQEWFDERKEARKRKDFARSDAIRDELMLAGVAVMDGDPLGWDWVPVVD